MAAALQFGRDYPPAPSEVEKLRAWPEVHQPTRPYVAPVQRRADAKPKEMKP